MGTTIGLAHRRGQRTARLHESCDPAAAPTNGPSDGELARLINAAVRACTKAKILFGADELESPATRRNVEDDVDVEYGGLRRGRGYAEGLATRVPFELPQQILRQHLDDFVLVSEQQIRAAQRAMIEATRNLVESSGAAPLAAALMLAKQLRGRRVALVASGGNLSRDQLLDILAYR